MTVMGDVFYFGCWPKGLGGAGHYLYLPSGHLLGQFSCPWEGAELDGTFCPHEQKQGHAKLTHESGWTILAFWDRTADKRSGSNSAFIAKGTFTFEGMVSLARRYYPGICKRVGKIRLVEPTSPTRAGGSLGAGLSRASEE